MIELDDFYAGSLNGRIGEVLGMAMCCPEFGTIACMSCELGLLRPLDVCDAHCATCHARKACPCTKAAWERRQDSAQNSPYGL